MKRSISTIEQIIGILCQTEVGVLFVDLYRNNCISDAIF